MADHTHIEWTDATWNPVTGCSIVSPGCTNCYAMKLAGTRLKHHPSRAGLTIDTRARGGEAVGRTGKQGHPVWNGQVRLNEGWLTQPLRWSRPRAVFVCAHGDLFHESVPDEWIDRVFAVMALAPHHTFQVLTKRAKRMREYMAPFSRRRADGLGAAVLALGYDGPLEALRWPLPNVWLGVSAERQQEADERVPELLATPAAVRFVSAEPLLGPIDFTRITHRDPAKFAWLSYAPRLNALTGNYPLLEEAREPHPDRIDWIIVGGESGQAGRPMHPAWARAIRDQCADAGVPFFFKQWGAFAPLRPDLIPTPTERQAWVHVDGAKAVRVKASHELDSLERDEDKAGRPLYAQMLEVGKKRAGRLLDDVEHNGMPAPREVPSL